MIIYKILIDLKNNKFIVPDLNMDIELPRKMELEEIIPFAREIVINVLKTEYYDLDKEIPARDSVEFKVSRNQIPTYIDIDEEILKSAKTSLEEMSEYDKIRIQNAMNVHENVFEWEGSNKTVSFTICQQKFINKIKKMAEKDPDSVKIIIENEDGSIYGKMLRKCLRINLPVKRDLTEEEREVLRNRLQDARNAARED